MLEYSRLKRENRQLKAIGAGGWQECTKIIRLTWENCGSNKVNLPYRIITYNLIHELNYKLRYLDKELGRAGESRRYKVGFVDS